jgi:acyl-CoA thioesterase
MSRPRWPEELGFLRDALDARFRGNPFLGHLGVELLDWGPGWARARLAPAPHLRNLVGTVHGGAIASMADAAFEVACNGYGRVCVALDLSTHFAAAADAGEALVAEAEEASRGRRTASYRITVRGEASSTPVAHVLAVAYRTARWHGGEDAYPESWRAAH